MNIIKDASGNIRYVIIDTSNGTRLIKDKNGNTLGTIRDGKTYDKSGSLVSFNEDISLLIR